MSYARKMFGEVKAAGSLGAYHERGIKAVRPQGGAEGQGPRLRAHCAEGMNSAGQFCGRNMRKTPPFDIFLSACPAPGLYHGAQRPLSKREGRLPCTRAPHGPE